MFGRFGAGTARGESSDSLSGRSSKSNQVVLNNQPLGDFGVSLQSRLNLSGSSTLIHQTKPARAGMASRSRGDNRTALR